MLKLTEEKRLFGIIPVTDISDYYTLEGEHILFRGMTHSYPVKEHWQNHIQFGYPLKHIKISIIFTFLDVRVVCIE